MSMSTRNKMRIAVVVVAAGWFGWSWWHGRHRAATADTTTASAPAAATPVAVAKPLPPDTPRSWKVGSLTLHSCELGRPGSGATVAGWCTTFVVPENRADPHSRKIGLKLALIRSEASKPDKDMAVLLAGGPGEAATASWSMVAPAFQGVLKHHDVLLLDQRGTGGSHPLSCDAAEQNNDNVSVGGLDLNQLRTQTQACLAEVSKRADPRYYTTTIAVQDLEDVRKALGSPSFDLVGVSYGTRVAQQYLMHYPDAVRSVVLDSPVPNQVVLGEDFAENLNRALKLDFAQCAATPACKKRFGDPMQTLYQLRDALRANPHTVTFRDPLSWDMVTRPLNQYALASVVRMFAYTSETAALLPLSIDAAAHGDVGPLLGQARLLNGDLSGDMNNGMSMSVICSEDADLLKPRPQDANTILGNHLIDAIQTECSVWPHGSRPADFHAPLKSSKPILILSGQFDPVTPPSYGKTILAGLSDARQLIFKGQGHSELMRGCMPRLLTRFIDKPDPAQLDAHCLDRLGPTPAFINFNGATP
ncbi:alpha/beta fold hydrolase [Dyella sp. A6]|uniref:alpha/beta fold hydrolase n=1 Tax=Dyella aluminiiresistens TaxID=3069105 RepID=UPI002E7A8D1A|nr:alpha/beta fold hydrolase [Dyella sp. A6]